MDEYADRLFSVHPEVEEIIVFGSFAKDTYVPRSDLDVFVVLSHSDQAFRDRIPELRPSRFPIRVDLFPYTREEVARLSPGFLKEVQSSTWRYQRPGPAQ